ncbi:phosphoenolpyruvate--protein phosphotransferase [Terasakiella sp. A23]|uniref:phosphoenolpyruvate--protein phosphotransferase n=1 Tax=Terasakiella sp. FCG-A23 TaxID=3080561 RepID=UPI002953BEF0|nr:phosphoenolpyruvate--protein phosphotransferase [Terasakiella sp. A23]MDV7338398.1 phosphoenolpyruvate--protein phosphotransferase [Terasakiella sp. A23]
MAKTKSEQILVGLGVAPGIGFGVAQVRENGSVDIAEYFIREDEIQNEIQRFEEALNQSIDQLEALKAKSKGLPDAAAEELGFMLDAHVHMLKGSRLVRGIETYIQNNAVNAESSVQHVLQEIVQGFKALDDAYIASRQSDIHQVAERILRNLSNTAPPLLQDLDKDAIVIAEELTPADTALMHPDTVFGFCTALGGPESHTAIMARALGIPAVLGIAGILGKVSNGDALIIDGTAGKIIINPTQKTKNHYQALAKTNQENLAELNHLRDRQAITNDGLKVSLMANVELPLEVDLVKKNGGEGIGLLRSEFMYMNCEDLPSEEDQYQTFKSLVTAMDGKPVTVRTLDIGGEKTARSLIEDFGDSICSPLGMRGIRLSLNRPDLLETQYRAILRAAVHGPIRILLPMVTSVNDVRQARRILHSVAHRMRNDGIDLPEYLPPLGAMIEVPGAALAADSLAQVCEFFAIGSNDLTMYTLATDRADETVAHLYEPLHPAVLRLIQFTTQAAKKNNIPISVCGEIAGNPKYTGLLIGLGIRDLSMGASSIPWVKQRLLEMDGTVETARATEIMEQTDSERIGMLLDKN